MEDLWDDIASTPEACPFTTGKRKYWRGENRISPTIQAQRSRGKEFSAQSAADMAAELLS
jgi:hypothetical protein